jgi:hypothetical protein
MELAISRTPDAKLSGIPVAIELLEIGQLSDLVIVFLELGILRCAELIHLGVVFHRENLPLFGQPLIKLQLQRRFRLLDLR